MSECFARDAYGVTFVARGWASPRTLSQQAYNSCRFRSRAPRTCRTIGCR
jgi:hypothetical protein